MSAYRRAIDQTIQVVERRARSFRNEVIAVVMIGVASVAVALALREPLALASILFLVPACGLFLCADCWLLNGWRSDTAASWARCDLDLTALHEALRAHPTLPKDTLEAMLLTLPSAGDLVEEQRIGEPARQAAAAATRAIHKARSDALLLDTILSGITATALLAALWMRIWTPLLGLAVFAARPVLVAWMRQRRVTTREAEVEAWRRHPGFSETDYARLLANQGAES